MVFLYEYLRSVLTLCTSVSTKKSSKLLVLGPTMQVDYQHLETCFSSHCLDWHTTSSTKITVKMSRKCALDIMFSYYSYCMRVKVLWKFCVWSCSSVLTRMKKKCATFLLHTVQLSPKLWWTFAFTTAEIAWVAPLCHLEFRLWIELAIRKDYRVTRSATCRSNRLETCHSRAGRVPSWMCRGGLLHSVRDHPVILRVPHGLNRPSLSQFDVLPQLVVRSVLSCRLNRSNHVPPLLGKWSVSQTYLPLDSRSRFSKCLPEASVS